MFQLFRWALPALLVFTARAEVYDAAADFSSTTNPNGVWSYTYAFPNSSPTLFTQTITPSPTGFPFAGWWTYLPIPDSIYMMANDSGSAYDINNRYVPNDSLWMDPEGGTISAVFTAPSAGYYEIAGSFLGADQDLTNDNNYPVEIFDNSNGVWVDTLSQFRQDEQFRFVVDLNSGDTISFSVLTGTEGCTYCFLSTAVQATVTPTTAPTPEPGARALSLTGAAFFVGLLWIRRCRRKTQVQ